MKQNELKVRSDHERDLSLLVSAAFGKGLKTFDAITRLCLLGFGEDALVLLRSNINLLINIAYILSSENPIDRASDFIAFSYKERVKYLKIAFDKPNPWTPRIPPDEIDRRAKSWGKITIETKAKAVPSFYYTQGYRFYSSIEHSDAWALSAYIEEWDERVPHITAAPTDKHMYVALVQNFGVMADFLLKVCQYFGIDRPDIVSRLQGTWAELGRR